jgi:hypothetical protein
MKVEGRVTWLMRRMARQIREIDRVMERAPRMSDRWHDLYTKRNRVAGAYVRRAKKILGE